MQLIQISENLLDLFINNVKNRYPRKAFGYFLSLKENGYPQDFVMFDNDVRNEWKEHFEQYGNYYKRNEDAGFLSTLQETYKVEKEILRREMYKVGVFHSHQRHPAVFSSVDVDLHPDKQLWHLIISLRNFEYPQIKIFSLDKGKIREIKVKIVD